MAQVIQSSDLGGAIQRGLAAAIQLYLGKERLKQGEQALEESERRGDFSRRSMLLGMLRQDIPRGSHVGLSTPETSAYSTVLRGILNDYGNLSLDPGAIDQMGLIVKEPGEDELFTNLQNEWMQEKLKLYRDLPRERQEKAMFGESPLGFAAGEQENVARISGAAYQDLLNKVKTGSLQQLTPEQIQFMSFNFTDRQFAAMQEQAWASARKAGLEAELADMTREGLGAATPQDVAAAQGFAPGTAQAVESRNTAEYIRNNLSANVDNFGITSFNELKSEFAKDSANAMYTYALNRFAPGAIRDPGTGDLAAASPAEAQLFAGYLSDEGIERQETLNFLETQFPTTPPHLRRKLVDWNMNGIPTTDGVRIPLFSKEGQQRLSEIAPQLTDPARALYGVWTTADQFQQKMLNDMGEQGRAALYQINQALEFAEKLPEDQRTQALEDYTKAFHTLYGENAVRYFERRWSRFTDEGFVLAPTTSPSDVEPGSLVLDRYIDEMVRVHREGKIDLSKASDFSEQFRKVTGRTPTGNETRLFMERIK